MSYALLTTSVNVSSSMGAILGNILVYPFHVSSHERFLRDSGKDRNVVALQYAIVFICNLGVLFFLPLLPRGKKETQAGVPHN